MKRILLLDEGMCAAMLKDRRRRGIDYHDEVWDGVHVIIPPPTNRQQEMVGDLGTVLREIIGDKRNGRAYCGVNVSDRKKGWEKNHRVPDVAVILRGSRAIDCSTHFHGGPDFLVEIDSPGHAAHEKLPFYTRIGVRELLILDRDSTRMWIYRHDGKDMHLVAPIRLAGKNWTISDVLPTAFRRKMSQGIARVEVRRTDGTPGHWTI